MDASIKRYTVDWYIAFYAEKPCRDMIFYQTEHRDIVFYQTEPEIIDAIEKCLEKNKYIYNHDFAIFFKKYNDKFVQTHGVDEYMNFIRLIFDYLKTDDNIWVDTIKTGMMPKGFMMKNRLLIAKYWSAK